ncbi:MAG: pseudouridine synthase [Clostridiales bacterium]|nr:pseudouridine synthase [Clostridiales bacterium]
MNEKDKMGEIRINRYIASAGICSRRKADELIASGEVTIDGRIAITGEKVSADQDVRVRGQRIGVRPDHVYLALNKPKGITCTASSDDPDNVIDYLSYERRVFPVGRLDKQSTGLLLLTDDGDTANRILRTDGSHEKEYHVHVDKPVTEAFIRSMSSGVPILDTVTLPCFIKKVSNRSFSMVLTQGLNRQIRRMCQYHGYEVTSLKRTRIMNIDLGRLPTGKWRYLEEDEVDQLKSMLRRSSPPQIQKHLESDEPTGVV